METKFNENETKKLLMEYYKKYEDKDVKVDFDIDIQYVGIYEDKSIETKILISEEIEFAGMKKWCTYKIELNEAIGYIKTVLDDYGFTVVRGEFSSCCCDDYRSGSYYFNGLNLELKRKNVVTLGKRN